MRGSLDSRAPIRHYRAVRGWQELRRNERLVLAGAIVAGIGLRILLLLTSYGTTDASLVTLWSDLVLSRGVSGAYAANPLVNHPPLALALMGFTGWIARAMDVPLTYVFRSLQILADLATILLLVPIGMRTKERSRVAVLFALTPVAIFVSGFHCNSDPLLVALITGAVALALSGRVTASAVVLAIATSVKIVPILLVPLFVFALWPRAKRFVLSYAAAIAVLFLPALLMAGPVMIRNVFGYAGFSGEWGIPALLMQADRIAGGRTSFASTAAAYAHYGKWPVALLLAAIPMIATRRRTLTADDLITGVPLLISLMVVLAPGFGVQYLVWPLPLLPLLIGRRLYAAIAGILGAYLFFAYTIWSGGFPWWLANPADHYPGTQAYIEFALIAWLALAIASVAGLWRFLSSAMLQPPDRAPLGDPLNSAHGEDRR